MARRHEENTRVASSDEALPDESFFRVKHKLESTQKRQLGVSKTQGKKQLWNSMMHLPLPETLRVQSYRHLQFCGFEQRK